MASSTVSGVGSGIDTQAIVKALVASEKAPKQDQITAQQKVATTQLSAVGTIKAALDTYRAAIAKLNTESSFSGLTGSSTDEKLTKVTIDSGASSGKYTLDVTQLATASKITTKVVLGGASAIVNTGAEASTLTISQSGSDYNVSIATGATLQEVRDSINTQLQSKGISANILTDATGSRLVMSSQTTGVGTDIRLGGNASLASGYTVVTTPQNAKYTIDSISMESKSNSVTSAVSGVNLEFLTEGKSTVTVGTSSTTLKSSVQSFVTAYNALITAVNTQTKVTATGDSATTASGALTGDATMRQLVSTVRGELVQGGGAGSISSLSQLGVNTDSKTGLLTIDDKKWDKAVVNGAGDIAKVFTGDNGLISRMTKATAAYAGTSGILATRTTNLNDKLTNLTTQQKALDRRIDSLTTSLSAKYAAMDSLVAKLNASSSSIMTTLNSLNNPKSD
jgi:flagellar hook-associated protein 2